MKILHFISGGDTGGAKTHVLTLLNKLRQMNVDVEILCIMEGLFTDEAKDLGIKVTVIPQKRRLDIFVVNKIKNYIQFSDYDLIHCHGARANYIAMLIRNNLKIPVITTLHSDYKLDFKDNFYKQLIFSKINEFSLRGFKHILTVTKVFKDMLIERGFLENRLEVVYNGINFDENINIISKYKFLEQFGLQYDENNLYIGIVARLQSVKGIKYFLESAKIISQKFDFVQFLVAGNGEQEDEFKKFVLENNLNDRISFLGFVKDVNSLYNLIDINVLSSVSESFPYALLEGARLKKATISTSVGGIIEMIDDNFSGLLVDKENSLDLANKMEFLINDSDFRFTLGQNFYADAKSKFSDENMALTHISIYKKILYKGE